MLGAACMKSPTYSSQFADGAATFSLSSAIYSNVYLLTFWADPAPATLSPPTFEVCISPASQSEVKLLTTEQALRPKQLSGALSTSGWILHTGLTISSSQLVQLPDDVPPADASSISVLHSLRPRKSGMRRIGGSRWSTSVPGVSRFKGQNCCVRTCASSCLRAESPASSLPGCGSEALAVGVLSALGAVRDSPAGTSCAACPLADSSASCSISGSCTCCACLLAARLAA